LFEFSASWKQLQGAQGYAMGSQYGSHVQELRGKMEVEFERARQPVVRKPVDLEMLYRLALASLSNQS
jgi:hypothetical protein